MIDQVDMPQNKTKQNKQYLEPFDCAQIIEYCLIGLFMVAITETI